MARLEGTRLILAVRSLRTATDFYVNALGFQRDFGDESDGWSWLSGTTSASAWASARTPCRRTSWATIRTWPTSAWTTLTASTASLFHAGYRSGFRRRRSRGECGNSPCKHQTVIE